MIMRRPVLLAFLLLGACERQVEESAVTANSIRATSPRSDESDAAATSIMRPEVAKEAAAPTPPPPVEPLRKVIEFGESGAALDDAARTSIDVLLGDPEFAEGGMITLSGHTDSAGSDAQNLAVSRRRAEAVRDYLRNKGVPDARITVIALGERRPREPNAHPDGSDFEEGRRRNRRVEIVVAPAPVPAAVKSPATVTRG